PRVGCAVMSVESCLSGHVVRGRRSSPVPTMLPRHARRPHSEPRPAAAHPGRDVPCPPRTPAATYPGRMTRPRRPDPPPMKTNDVRIAAAGTAAWAVALVVLLIVGLPSDDRWWLWVCVAGIGIGLFGIWYIPRLQAARARQEAARRERETAD